MFEDAERSFVHGGTQCDGPGVNLLARHRRDRIVVDSSWVGSAQARAAAAQDDGNDDDNDQQRTAHNSTDDGTNDA